MEDTLQVRDTFMKPSDGNMNVAKIHYHAGIQASEHRLQQSGYCSRCDHHMAGNNCPAYGKQCRNCLKWNHFAKVCRSQQGDYGNGSSYISREDWKQQQQEKPQMKSIKDTTEEDLDSSTSSDDDYFHYAVMKHLGQIRKVHTVGSNTTNRVFIRMNGIDVSVEPDSGSDVNIMDKHQFKALANRSTKKPVLHHSNMRLRAFQNDLQVKGEFRTMLRNKNRGTEAKILVIKGRINSAPLISKSTSEQWKQRF